jgi:sporulation protein YlmC with PRC-barrel domain
MKRHGGEIRVEWTQIKKIGTDMMIIDMEPNGDE